MLFRSGIRVVASGKDHFDEVPTLYVEIIDSKKENIDELEQNLAKLKMNIHLSGNPSNSIKEAKVSLGREGVTEGEKREFENLVEIYKIY